MERHDGYASSILEGRHFMFSAQDLKRKQTLRQLIDELEELKRKERLSQPYGKVDMEDMRERDIFVEAVEYEDPSLREGAEAFRRFDRQVFQLDQGLQAFQTAVRRLYSSVGLVASASQLRIRLNTIKTILHENAMELFPGIKSQAIEQHQHRIAKAKRIKVGYRRARKKSTATFLSPVVSDSSDPEALPEELMGLAKDMESFHAHLEDFPELADERITASMTTFENDLRYCADCLSEYAGQFRWPAVQRYVHALGVQMETHLRLLTEALKTIVDDGIPVIDSISARPPGYLLNLATMAIFFSSVTATSAQFSSGNTDKLLDNVVNLLFFGSLVLSITAAINSLLALSWRGSRFRSPRYRVPWWMLIWIKRSPLFFMIASVLLFNAGLVCYCFSQQHLFVSVTILALTIFCIFVLVAVAAWFAAERWVYSKHNGVRWLSDEVDDLWTSFIRWPVVRFISYIPQRISARTRQIYYRAKTLLSCWTTSRSDLEDGLPSPHWLERKRNGGSPLSISPRSTEKGLEENTEEPESEIGKVVDTVATMSAPGAEGSNAVTTSNLTGASRFRAIGWKVIAMQREMVASPGDEPAITMPTRSTAHGDSTKKQEKEGTSSPLSRPRHLRAVQTRVKSIQVTHTSFDHTALVRHLQFSPDGKLLATCSWDGTARLFDVPQNPNDPLGKHRILATSGFSGQVAWNNDGQYLLVKGTNAIQIWGEDGVRKKKIMRGQPVRAVTWFPTSRAFLSVEDNQVVEIDTGGKILDTHELTRLTLQDVAIMNNEERMLGVALLRETTHGYQPVMSRFEKRIVVYNLQSKKIESLVPVLDNVSYISISRSERFALVSSEKEGNPQLFRIDIVFGSMRLVPIHTYMPKTIVDFAGPSLFAGPSDEFIMVATKSGDILFWDRESGVPLHALRDDNIGDGDLISVAWNYASKKYMLASALHDGTVRIWISGVVEPRKRRRPPVHEDTAASEGPIISDTEQSVYLSPPSHRGIPSMPVSSFHARDLSISSPDAGVGTEGTEDVTVPVHHRRRRRRKIFDSSIPIIEQNESSDESNDGDRE